MTAAQVTYDAPCDRCPALARWSATSDGGPATVTCPECDPTPFGPLPLREAVVASTAAWLRKLATG